MAPFYKYLHDEYLPKGALQWDEKLYKSLIDRNQQDITELKERLQEVEEKDEGELEKAQAWVKLGEYYAQIGDKANACLLYTSRCV